VSAQLRVWWDEPRLIESVRRAERVRILRDWIESLERNAAWVGARHPLLCLCGPDLVEAWGEKVQFIWSYRPLENSIRSLGRRGWWPDAGSIQRRLWHAVTEFLADRQHLRVEFADLMADPARQVRRVADFLGLEPSTEQVAAAVASVRPTSAE
jgi:hypothetical protein